MIAYLRGEPGSHVVDAALRSVTGRCYAHAVNMMEVYYDFVRVGSPFDADSAVHDLAAAGIHIRMDMDEALWKDAGMIKVANRVSLADSLCLSLSRRLALPVLTSDHHEFDMIVASGVAKVVFLR